jgi:hypothetical protein
MRSLPGKIVVVQASSGASYNASLPSTRHRERLVNRLAQRTAPRESQHRQSVWPVRTPSLDR